MPDRPPSAGGSPRLGERPRHDGAPAVGGSGCCAGAVRAGALARRASTGSPGGAGRAEVSAGEGKRSDSTREAAGGAVGRGLWHRAGPGPCWRRGAGLTLPAGECGHGVCYGSRSASCSEARPGAAVARRRGRGRSPLRAVSPGGCGQRRAESRGRGASGASLLCSAIRAVEAAGFIQAVRLWLTVFFC